VPVRTSHRESDSDSTSSPDRDTNPTPDIEDLPDELKDLEETVDDPEECLADVPGVSFVTAVVTMTVWSRVDRTDLRLALCQTSVTFSAMAFGAALGDSLPGS